MKRLHSDQWLGLVVLVLALVLLFVWIPLDTGTGLIEQVRRRVLIGDALAPSVAACVLILGAVLTWLKPAARTSRLTAANLRWMLALVVMFTLSLGLMRYLGPLVAAVLTDTGYRPLRNTVPWKYIGYAVGGTVMIAGLSRMSQPRPIWRLVLIGAVATMAIALAYDVPFDTLLLPPNGDL